MPAKNITLSVDEEIYNRYRLFCKKKGLLVSRQFEIMMEQQLLADDVSEGGKRG